MAKKNDLATTIGNFFMKKIKEEKIVEQAAEWVHNKYVSPKIQELKNRPMNSDMVVNVKDDVVDSVKEICARPCICDGCDKKEEIKWYDKSKDEYWCVEYGKKVDSWTTKCK